MMEFEEQKKKAEASGGPSLLVGYDKLLYMSELQAVPGDDEYGNQDLDAKFTKFTLKTEHITRLKREVIEILSSCEGNCFKLSQFKSRYHKWFGKKFSECYRLSGGRKEFCNLMAELDLIEFDQNGSRPLMKLKEPQASQHMSFNVARSEHNCATDEETRETRRPRFVKRRETVAPRSQSQNTSLDAIDLSEKLIRLKKDIVDMLRSCERNCLYLSQLQEEYGKTFHKRFFTTHKVLLRGKCLSKFLGELDIIEVEDTGEKDAKNYLMKLREPHASQFMLNMGFDNEEKPSSLEKKDPESVENRKGLLSQNIGIDSGYFPEKLTMFKKDIVNLLKSCEGNCLYLSELPDKYRQTFGRKFHRAFRVLFKGNGLVQFLSELDIIILERTGEKGEKKYLLKLKEPHANLFMQRTNLNTAEELDSSSNFGYRQDEFDSKEPTKSLRPASLADDLAVAAGPIIARVPTVPLAPLDQNVSDSRVQSPALETTFQASPLVLSTSLMRGPSHTVNIPEGM